MAFRARTVLSVACALLAFFLGMDRVDNRFISGREFVRPVMPVSSALAFSASWNAKLLDLGPTCNRITRKPAAQCVLAPGCFPGASPPAPTIA